jgi:hypothetical protein
VVHRGTFDAGTLHAWLARLIASVEADTWSEIGERLARFGYRELEDSRA